MNPLHEPSADYTAGHEGGRVIFYQRWLVPKYLAICLGTCYERWYMSIFYTGVGMTSAVYRRAQQLVAELPEKEIACRNYQ